MTDILTDTPPTNDKRTECRVCSGYLGPYEEICGDCEEYKERADNLRKALLRRKAFGDVI